MSGFFRWPDRRRLADSLLAVLAPVVACSVALVGLTIWVGVGNAGSPARIHVTDGRVLLPVGGSQETAAFFRISNEGGAADRLVGVTSPDAPGGVTLARHRMTGGGAAYRALIESVGIPAQDTLTMSSYGVDLTVTSPAGEWRAGDLVPFTLEFRRSGRIKVLAVVVTVGTAAL
ncbi:MAG: copper chaperone PCu(A)C [Streptomycetaceae bacterium]|nr:copper chaperone PCu(A)C [Streptomycetaceae bacterium]